jgi:hypothetical protein
VAILTGDIHSSWAFDVPRSPLRGYSGTTGEGSLAVELVTPAISSPPLYCQRLAAGCHGAAAALCAAPQVRGG